MNAASASETDTTGGQFVARHVGLRPDDVAHMLKTIGADSVAKLIDETVPDAIRMSERLDLPAPLTETEALARLRDIADKNTVATSLIGRGYYDTITPTVILRNVLENPAWYTAYTPYQPEISQGRLEALLNFQTMVADLTGMDLANASMLDEATAAAEAMTMCRRQSKVKGNRFVVDPECHPQVIAVVHTRAEPLGFEIDVADPRSASTDDSFGVLLAHFGTTGRVEAYADVAERFHAAGALVAATTDLLGCVLVESPGAWGADVVVGSAQRFGVPLGFGGPHAGFMATTDAQRRALPGRLVGTSVDADGAPANRLALQTREQHIRREKATSNICTAQVLLAVMAAMYATYHGPEGLRRIASGVHTLTNQLAGALQKAGFTLTSTTWFDTVSVEVADAASVLAVAAAQGYNLGSPNATTVSISLDETSTTDTVAAVLRAFGAEADDSAAPSGLAAVPVRTAPLLDFDVFSAYRSETEMMRYLRRLSDMDLALDRTMIPLGSCTMKLNAATEMQAVTWPEFANIHPFAPANQASGYHELIDELCAWLVEITGYAAVSLQPNAGSQGELAGLLAIREYHRANDDTDRTVCLIPASAHGTNAASAVMAGMSVVVVACDDGGNVDMGDLAAKLADHGPKVAAIMVTYPSTHGVFEPTIVDICDQVHAVGGQVYVDGANLNALVGLARPGRFGADVSHLNLHKTFCIPHGGGGPGIGPVAVGEHLAPYLPAVTAAGPATAGSVGAVSAAPFGSAGILPIPWAYIAMMGADGLLAATENAIVAANYMACRLDGVFPVLYTGANGRVAHECIVDLRPLAKETGISNEDVAKRLIDYGFHAPTMSFPVPGTLMVEPTESEPLAELDRFCDAMIAIRAEIDRVASGEWPADDNPLVNAPHTSESVLVDEWTHPYTRSEAAYPPGVDRRSKYWPPVRRIDGGFGDRHLVCSCPPPSAYADD